MMWFLRHVLLLGFEDVFAQVEERGADRLKGFKAVAERVLLVRSHFRQRLPYFGNQKNRIIAETIGPARPIGDIAI